MKCPKCGYLGFETTDRCRHCGYDFSLSAPAGEPLSELPLRSSHETESALADLDLDRIIGAPGDEAPARLAGPSPAPSSELRAEVAADGAALPLFTRRPDRIDVVTPPPPAGAPLAVRRATPEVPRRRTPRTIRRDPDGLPLQLEPAAAAGADRQPVSDPVPLQPVAGPDNVPKARRFAAAIFDILMLGAINIAILYLTLAIAGLSLSDALTLPLVPMGAFLMLLNAGYLIAFTIANGQTIGKMLFGLRVVGDDTARVEIGVAVLRSLGVMLSVVTLGLAYLPALFSRDGRALHDRLAGTRVVKHA